MADDIVIFGGDKGTQYLISTDEVGGKHYQRVKLVAGVDGSASDLHPLQPNADANATNSINLLTNAYGYVFNGTTWDRARSAQAQDGVASHVGVAGSAPMHYDQAAGVWRMGRTAYTDTIAPGYYPGEVPMLYNGTTHDRQRGNEEAIVVLASAARTATVVSPVFKNYNARGIVVEINITAASGTGGLTVSVFGSVNGGGNYYAIVTDPTPITIVTYAHIVVYPGAVNVTGTRATSSQPLTRSWLVNVNHANATSYTYSVTAGLIV